MADQAQAAAHWDAACAQGDDTRSWFETSGHVASHARLCRGLGRCTDRRGRRRIPSHQAALDRGFRDLTVLDISAAGMQHARDRLGSLAEQVRWLIAAVLSWHSGVTTGPGTIRRPTL